MSRQRMEVLLAVSALEPLGYGESVRCYLKHCGVQVQRAPVYRQLQNLFDDGMIKVARSSGLREYLRTTAKGSREISRWFKRLNRIASQGGDRCADLIGS